MKTNGTIYTRRDLLGHALPVAAVASTMPGFLAHTVLASPTTSSQTSIPGIKDNHILVVLQLSGGNDGLNTIIPHTHDDYHRARPRIGLKGKEVISLSSGLGLHKNLSGLADLIQAGECTFIQGVGYPNPNRSHFRSMDIWQSASGQERVWPHGWIGRYFDNACGGNDPIPATAAITIGQEVPLAMRTPQGGAAGIVLQDPESYAWQPAGRSASQNKRQSGLMEAGNEMMVKQPNQPHIDYLQRTALDASQSSALIAEADKRYRSSVEYPNTGLARDLKLIARMIAGQLPTRVYYASIGGFDTHANQPDHHASLLRTIDEAVVAFRRDLQRLKEWDRVVIMGFSEFGRRVAQNDSTGTDHGAAGPMFLIGKPLKGGLIGEHPSLTDLTYGDLKHSIDFRQVYGTVLDQWLGLPHQKVLADSFTRLPLFAS